MRIRLLGVWLVSAVVAACTNSVQPPTAPSQFSVPVEFDTAQHADVPHNFRTHMTGGEEVPANDSRAQGQSIFQLSPDGTELHYRLIVANIQNVTQAHIHLAPAGQNGGIVVWLYPAAPPAQLIPGRSQGVLATGVITDANLVGTLAGGDLSDLVDEMLAGNAYVNVHTSQFPPGEIRGQID